VEGPEPRLVALGTAGAPAPGRLTTTFLLSGGVLIDAGAAAHALDPARRDEIHTLFLSHAHLDHTLGLPFLLGRAPLAVHGLRPTLDAVKESLLEPEWVLLPELITATSTRVQYDVPSASASRFHTIVLLP